MSVVGFVFGLLVKITCDVNKETRQGLTHGESLGTSPSRRAHAHTCTRAHTCYILPLAGSICLIKTKKEKSKRERESAMVSAREDFQREMEGR